MALSTVLGRGQGAGWPQVLREGSSQEISGCVALLGGHTDPCSEDHGDAQPKEGLAWPDD